MNLERSINNLSKRIERLDSIDGDGNDSNHWKGKQIIPLNDWIQLRGTPYALQYFPDDFDRFHTFLTEIDLKESDEQIKNKQDLYQASTNREAFERILDQGLGYILSGKETFDDVSRFDQLQKDNRDKVVDCFISIEDKIKLEELRFY